MPRLRKAWEVRLKWSDDSDIRYAATASKARYSAYLDWSDSYCSLTLMHIQVKRAAYADVTLPDEHRLVAELTEEQRDIVAHAYGKGRRNHFCTEPGDINMLRLAWEFGLFSGPHGEREYGRTPGWAGAFFYLTSLGKQVAASMLPTYPRH
jgi:hypothetical protein